MKKAFTLIELLVVIAIIAILAAILFPVFAQAKLAAKKSVDLSNLKQLALAGEMWKSDHDGYLVQASYNYFSHGEATGIPWPLGSWRYALQPYIKNRDIFKSPLDPGLKPSGQDTKTDFDTYTCNVWDDSTGYCKDPDKNWLASGKMPANSDDFATSYRLNSSNQPGYLPGSIDNRSIHFRTSANESGIDQLASLILIVPSGFGVGQDVPYDEVTTADAGYDNDIVCINDVTNVDFDRTNRQPKNPTKAQIAQGRANYGVGDGHATNLSYRATWKTLGPETKDSAGNAVAPTMWRQSFAGAPDKCLFREGDPR